ncbi:MAG: DUF6398 domain-containing protein [Eubacteriaceae bacterium]|nr:DUF6398 domain-containing protein [Eubacteriaceae bacterium]
MVLNREDRTVFFSLYSDLLYYVNKKYGIVGHIADAAALLSNPAQAITIRDQLFSNLHWFDEYIADFSSVLSADEFAMLSSWRDSFLKGKFYLMRYLSRHSVFMSTGEDSPAGLFGVWGLNKPVKELFPKQRLPMSINALLLPFKGKIIHDGLIARTTISESNRILERIYRELNKDLGIIESLSIATTDPQSGTPQISSGVVPSADIGKHNEIESMLVWYCNQEALPQGFLDVCIFSLDVIASRPQRPLRAGKTNTWACGIIFAIASHNNLFNSNMHTYLKVSDIAERFGVSQTTVRRRGAQTRKLLQMGFRSSNYRIKI